MFEGGEELVASTDPFDIILLDMQMGGMNGMDTARMLRAKTQHSATNIPQIIFVTAFPDFMQQAFDVNAFHYLLKPLDEEKFRTVLNQAIMQIEKGILREQRKISVRSSYKERVQIIVGHIKYIESDNKLLTIHTIDGDVETRGQIAQMEETLGDGFFRCHRSFIVNLDMVAGFTMDTVKLLGGGQVLLAKKNHMALAEAVAQRVNSI